MKAICISGISSNCGKTTLSTALLYHFKKSVRPFKIGPDFIDPQFHQSICHTPSINLDSFIMTQEQVKWLFQHYSNKNFSVLEGVMGFYDGMDKGCSAYEVSKLLNVPSILLLDGSGSYITVVAVLKGLLEFQDNNTIKAVILNKLSSSMHYELIKKHIQEAFPHIAVLGWILKDLPILKSTHLGLDLEDNSIEHLRTLSKEVLKHIDMKLLEEIAEFKKEPKKSYPFETIEQHNKILGIVKDKNFSFLYHDNIEVLKQLFKEVYFIDATKDETIPAHCDVLYIPGGYVETQNAFQRIKNSNQFKTSLQSFSQTKTIYAECAGLVYLGKQVDDMPMSGILNIEFTLQEKRERLGYYYNHNGIKGHAFHYTKPLNAPKECEYLSKTPEKKGKASGWQKNGVYGSYFHLMFRNNILTIKDYFGI